MTTEQLAVREPTQLPAPLFHGADMVRALEEYRELQKALDERMPDQLMILDGRPFRKKGYWRAIAVAFHLTVEPILETEKRFSVGELEDGTENYVWTIAYRASTPSGRYTVGDGTCSASEKQRGRMKATEHNVRSHAHTRAFNRAVSNLVGFGEVSAEEIERGDDEEKATVPAAADGSVLVREVAEKTGQNKQGRPWTLFTVHFDDGRSASTFDEGLAARASQAAVAAYRVIPAISQQGQHKNLMGLRAVEEEMPSEPSVETLLPRPGELEERKRLLAEMTRLGRKLKPTMVEWHQWLTTYLGSPNADPATADLAALTDLVKFMATRAGE